MGVGVSLQTVINSRLRSYLMSPLLASVVSFTVGSAFLALILLFNNEHIFPTIDLLQAAPKYIWTGGFLGAIWITGNIFLFQRLGAVQTAIFPILGQIITSVLIDHFGWLGVNIKAITSLKILGITLVLVGILVSITLPFNKAKLVAPTHAQLDKNASPSWTIWLWRLFGISGGAVIAIQSPINTQLSRYLDSPIQASFTSFFIGMLVLIIVYPFTDKTLTAVSRLYLPNRPWWVWMGGVLGGCFVMLSVILVPWIGVSQMLVLVLLGQLSGSLCVDTLGWFGVPKKKILMPQIIGIMMLVVGVVIIRLI